MNSAAACSPIGIKLEFDLAHWTALFDEEVRHRFRLLVKERIILDFVVQNLRSERVDVSRVQSRASRNPVVLDARVDNRHKWPIKIWDESKLPARHRQSRKPLVASSNGTTYNGCEWDSGKVQWH